MATKPRPVGQPEFVMYGDHRAPVIGEGAGDEFVLYDDVPEPPPSGGVLIMAPADGRRAGVH